MLGSELYLGRYPFCAGDRFSCLQLSASQAHRDCESELNRHRLDPTPFHIAQTQAAEVYYKIPVPFQGRL